MGNGHHQLDVSAALTSHFFLSDLDAATVADDALVANALVLAASTLVVLRGTEDALAEQTVALRLIGTVVDGLRLGYFAKRVLKDFFR